MKLRRKAWNKPSWLRGMSRSMSHETAMWMGRVAAYEDGCHDLGGPDAQSARLMHAVGIVRGEQGLLEAGEAAARNKE